MRLTGPEIERQVALGAIVIYPFNQEQLGPNSYDLLLGPELAYYGTMQLDCRREYTEEDIVRVYIPEEGYVLSPGRGYLASTVEVVGAPGGSGFDEGFVPHIEGKSGLGRLFLQVHMTAGFGDDGFVGAWTLEMCALQPIRIYAGQCIAQAHFEPTMGRRDPYRGSYQDQRGPQVSRFAQSEARRLAARATRIAYTGEDIWEEPK